MVRTLRGPYGNNQANHLFILDKKIKKKNKNKKLKKKNKLLEIMRKLNFSIDLYTT